jgi:MoaA/NifB/PqqE/SkfB family radical SAM enzyme
MKYKKEVNNYYNPDSKRQNNLFSYYQRPIYKAALNAETMPDFPFVSSLEFTNHCTLDCLFCARAVMTRPLGFMSRELFFEIIEEYRQHGIFIKVNGYGENLLHPDALEFIREIKKENGLYFTSNCITLNERVADCMIENRVDVLQVSFQGLDKNGYEEQRRRGNYDVLIGNLKNFVRLRGDAEYPLIHLSTTVLDEPDHEIENFIGLGFEIGVDSVGIGRTDYDRVIEEMIKDAKRKGEINEMKKRQSLEKHSDHTYLYKYIDVNWDGIVVSSFFDFNEFVPVGDLNKQTMHEIWNHSEVLNAIRVLEKNKLLNNMKVFDTFYHAWHLGSSSYNLESGEVL